MTNQKNSPVNLPQDPYSPLSAQRDVAMTAHREQSPGFWETAEAMFEKHNEAGSYFSSAARDLSTGDFYRADPDFNITPEMLTGFSDDEVDSLLDTYNADAFEAVKSDILRERKNTEIENASGWMGFALGLAAGVASPTTLIPGGGLARVGKVGYSTLRSAASFGLASAAGTSLQEGMLQMSQQTRSGWESAAAIGGAFAFGSVTGGVGAKLYNHSDWAKFSRALEEELAGDLPNSPDVAQTMLRKIRKGEIDLENLDKTDWGSDLGIGGGRAVEAIVKASAATRLNPGLELLTSPSQATRKVFLKLAENHVATKGEMEGRTLGPAVETSMQRYNGALAGFLNARKMTYRSARAAGFQGSVADYDLAVARAVRNDTIDPDGNPFVTEAATAWRAVADMIREEGIDAGVIDGSPKARKVASSLYRVFDQKKIAAGEAGDGPGLSGIIRAQVNDALEAGSLRQNETDRAGTMTAADYGRSPPAGVLEEPSAAGRALAEQGAPHNFDLLRGRVPREVLAVAKSGRGNDELAQTVRQAVDLGTEGPSVAAIEKWLIEAGLPADVTLGDVRAHLARGLNNEDRLSHLDQAANQLEGELAEFDRLAEELLGDGAGGHGTQKSVPGEASTDAGRQGLDVATGTQFEDALNTLEAATNKVRALAGDDPDVKALLNLADARRDLARAKLEQRQVSRKIDAAQRDLAKKDLPNETNAGKPDASGEGQGNGPGAGGPGQSISSALSPKPKSGGGIAKTAGELQAELRRLLGQKNRVDEKAIKADAKLRDLNKKLPKTRDSTPDFTPDLSPDDYARQIADDMFDQITGKSGDNAPGGPFKVSHGPLKGQTIELPDELIEGFLVNDMEVIAREFVGKMAPEIELTRTFGSADMKNALLSIRKDYDALRAQAKDAAEIEKLNAREKRDIEHIEAFRDILRGTYKSSDPDTNWSTITRLALGWNYMRTMGGMAFDSVQTSANVLTRQGVHSFLKEGLPALISNARSVRISKRDGRDHGTITGTALQSKFAEMADTSFPYASGRISDKVMANMLNAFSKLTFAGAIDDVLRTVVTQQTSTRIARLTLSSLRDYGDGTGKVADFARLSSWDRSYLGKLGINQTMATRVADQVQRFSVKEDGVWGLNLRAWTDKEAQRAVGAALAKETNGSVVAPGIADRPLWTRTNGGKLLMQFRTASLAAHQRVMISRLQGRRRHLAEFLLFGTMMGMATTYFKHIATGDIEKAEALLDNPALWVAEGFDSSGIAPVLMYVSNTAERAGLPYGVKSAARAIDGSPAGDGDGARNWSDAVSALGGPTAELFQDLSIIAREAHVGDFSEESADALARQTPFGNLPGVGAVMQQQVKPALIDAVK